MRIIRAVSALVLLFCYHAFVRRIDWRALACVLTICAFVMAMTVPCAAAAQPSVFTCPVFLNAEPVYSRTGPASLLSITADAVREGTKADVALLPASAAEGTLPEGPASEEDLALLFFTGDTLVRTRVSGSELCTLLNEIMTFGSPLFPHVSGVYVRAERILDAAGQYAGLVQYVQQSTETIAARSTGEDQRYSAVGDALELVTTASIAAAVPWLSARVQAENADLANLFVQHMRRTPDAAISYYAQSQRLVIAADTIDAQLAIAKLALPIPAPVVENLTYPETVADTVMYALNGQDRELTCRILDTPIPYALTVSGLSVRDPVSLDTAVSVTQTLPPARKTANTFDDDTVFCDLRYNDTVPDGSELSVNLTGIYPSETVLHVYYYDLNGDIVPLGEEPIVDASGWISFPVDASTTYIINARQLDSAAFEPPSTAHPYTLGIAAIFAAFCIWFFVFIAKKRKTKEAVASPADPEPPL